MRNGCLGGVCDEVAESSCCVRVIFIDLDVDVQAIVGWVGEVLRVDVDAGAFGLGEGSEVATHHEVSAHGWRDTVRPPVVKWRMGRVWVDENR